MSDDESAPVTEEPQEQEAPAESEDAPEPQPDVELDTFTGVPISEGDPGEAKRVMEEAARKKKEKVELEIAEYQEQRQEEKKKEEEELRALRDKREQRRLERIEEEKRLAERRREEDARKKAEDEERRRKKQEEEAKKAEEKARKLKEMEEKRKMAKTPNYVINKKDGDAGGQEEQQKSKEQLEEEKRAILAQRIGTLSMDGMDAAALLAKAKEIHAKLLQLAADKYDLEERFKRQQYDMIELSERARQMNKGKARRGVQVDESFDKLADKFVGAPPKIQLCSKYERHTDHRTYGQRLKLFEELSSQEAGVLKKECEEEGGNSEEPAPAPASAEVEAGGEE